MIDNRDWSNLDWGRAIELALCVVSFLLGFAGVSGAVTAIGLGLGFAARHAERWPVRLLHLRDKRPMRALMTTIAIALCFDALGSFALYELGALLRD